MARAPLSIKHLVLLFLLITKGEHPFSVNYFSYLHHGIPLNLQKCVSVNPSGGTGFPPRTKTSCNSVIESCLVLPDLYTRTTWAVSDLLHNSFHRKEAIDLQVVCSSVNENGWMNQ
jgi:hypothetical protein